ncbi:MAG: hypothetical protein HQ592_05080, partial [Planctomycetes bacterium]|nr:hypothetical protein [Planctomycetota bacterium]
MCKRAFAGTVFLCAMLVVVGFADGAVPRLIDFQGRLTDADADPVSGTKSMVFEFRNLPAGGILLGAFSETQSVTVTDGIFNATIGSETTGGIPSTIFDSVLVYLSVTVAGEELLPRRRVVAVAYALRAEKALSANHATSADSADTALTAD